MARLLRIAHENEPFLRTRIVRAQKRNDSRQYQSFKIEACFLVRPEMGPVRQDKSNWVPLERLI